MSATILTDWLVSAGARLGEYEGVRTAAVFTGPASERRALRHGCGIYDLSWRAHMRIGGEDRVRWLNGVVTNNIRDLAPGHGVYSFVLNPQGRIQGDLYVYNRGDCLLADTTAAQFDAVWKIFDHYIVMDDVELSDMRAQMAIIGLRGPAAADVLARSGIDLPPLDVLAFAEVEWRGSALTLVRAEGEPQAFELRLAPEHAPPLWDALRAAGAQPLGFEALEAWRILAGVPRYGVDIRERDLPQETGQQRALHFSKGCYLGQEIVERIRSRGQVHRTLIGFVTEDAPPSPGTKVELEGREVGELTSVLPLPQRSFALGYLRREALNAPELLAGGSKLRPATLPFQDFDQD